MKEKEIVAVTVSATGKQELDITNALLLLMSELGLRFIWDGAWKVLKR